MTVVSFGKHRLRFYLDRIRYFKANWKVMVHLALGTYRFGVNNKWWSDFDSMFGVPIYKRTPRRILKNYRIARWRALACYTITKESTRLIGWDKHLSRHKKVHWGLNEWLNGGCPFCGCKEVYEGPHGGLSVNVQCCDCRAEFNVMGLFGVDLLSGPCPTLQ